MGIQSLLKGRLVIDMTKGDDINATHTLLQAPSVKRMADVCVFFVDPDAPNGFRMWIGKIISMVSRPKTGNAKKWFKPVLLTEITDDLWLRCVWYTPYPKEGESIYTTGRFTVFDADSVSMSKDNVQEFQARSVISIVEMRSQEGGVWEMKATHLEHAKKFMDSRRMGVVKKKAKVAGGSESERRRVLQRKRKKWTPQHTGQGHLIGRQEQPRRLGKPRIGL